MSSSAIRNEATKVGFAAGKLVVHLADGRSLSVPLQWYPRLSNATPKERKNWVLLGGGYAIEWPDLDEHIGIDGLLAGRRSGESSRSLAQWLSARRRKPTRPQPA